jgi:Beta/Gamma crystallin
MMVARGNFHGKNKGMGRDQFCRLRNAIYGQRPDLTAENGRGSISGSENWNDQISSWKVDTGQWQFFEHAGYGGVATKVYGPGECLNCVQAGFSNKWISSIRKIGD